MFNLLKQIFFLFLFVFCQLFGLVDLLLLFALNFLRVRTEVRVQRDFVADGLPVVIDLLIQQFEQALREKLEVLDDRLLGRPKNKITNKF